MSYDLSRSHTLSLLTFHLFTLSRDCPGWAGGLRCSRSRLLSILVSTVDIRYSGSWFLELVVSIVVFVVVSCRQLHWCEPSRRSLSKAEFCLVVRAIFWSALSHCHKLLASPIDLRTETLKTYLAQQSPRFNRAEGSLKESQS